MKCSKKVMVEGTHYGKVPGCGNKMVLLKPGADVLAMVFKLVPQFQVIKNDLANGSSASLTLPAQCTRLTAHCLDRV